MEQEGIVCSECNTLNELGWSFCQQCGKRLVQPQPVPSQPPAQPPPQLAAEIPPGLKTVPEKRPVVDPDTAKSFKTVDAKPPQADHGLRTVADKPPPPEQASKPVAPEPPPVDHEAKTVREVARAVEPEIAPETPVKQPPPAAPVNAKEPPVSGSPPVTKSGTTAPPPKVVAPPKVDAQLPHDPKPVAPPAPAQKPAAPPAVVTPEQTTQHAQPVSGVLCTQCGQATSVGSAFCASCGAPVTYGGKTMVISSQPAPAKGRLHLVMEGGQPGEVYELDDETVIGRSSGEITFPHDGFMSGRHARIVRRGATFILTDEGSRNGTFVKINGEVELKPGDTILVGKQLFRFEV